MVFQVVDAHFHFRLERGDKGGCLSHVVKDVGGRQPMEWIRDYVLLNTKTLLRSGQYSVQQVSELLAFPNPSFFGKYFREHVEYSTHKYQMQDNLKVTS